MSYYRICPYCGAALDPGEKCGCLTPARNAAADKKRPPALRQQKRTA